MRKLLSLLFAALALIMLAVTLFTPAIAATAPAILAVACGVASYLAWPKRQKTSQHDLG